MRKAIVIAAAVMLVASIVGFVTSLMVNVFVLDDYDAYGEVPIPGTATLHLPAGDASISFHSQIIGSTSGSGLPIPDLDVTITPQDGVAKPQLTEDVGATTTVNSDAHRRVWVAHIAEAGDYTVKTDGKVSAYINPRLSFGHASQYGYLPWAFAGLFALSLVALLAAIFVPRRTRQPPASSSPSAVEA